MTARNEQEARRTAVIFAMAQAVIGSVAPISIALGGLAGHYLLGVDKTLATLPVTAYTIGVAVGTVPAAGIIKALGQRSGFILGAGITAVGGAVAAFGLYEFSFWLFAFGLLWLGLGGAFVQKFRFAAADNAPSAYKAKSISFVLAGGVVTAILGPQIVIYTKDLFTPVMFAGAFVSVIGLAAVGALILSFLQRRRIDADRDSATPDIDESARSLGEVVRQPVFAVGLLCATGSYALMSFVMTGAPLAMVGCGFTSDEAALGISWHVMAMFAPSFFTGRLIARFGRENIVATGLVLLVGCAIIALSGIALWQFWSALILLGLGWNFAFIGATAMVADTYNTAEKDKVQGIHDLVLFGTVAFASLMSGVVYHAWGWEILNWMVFPVAGLCLAGLGGLYLMSRSRLSSS